MLHFHPVKLKVDGLEYVSGEVINEINEIVKKVRNHEVSHEID